MKFHENNLVGAKFFPADGQIDITRPLIVFGDYPRSKFVIAVFATTVTSQTLRPQHVSTAQYCQVCSCKCSLNYWLLQCSWQHRGTIAVPCTAVCHFSLSPSNSTLRFHALSANNLSPFQSIITTRHLWGLHWMTLMLFLLYLRLISLPGMVTDLTVVRLWQVVTKWTAVHVKCN